MLFFDLVFFFAITELARGLLWHLVGTGALQTLILLFAVWWVWIYTTWAANWLDPERANVRLMLILLMLAGLVLSSAIPYAFGVRGWMFAAAYCMIGRASCRERECQYVWSPVGAVSLKKKNNKTDI